MEELTMATATKDQAIDKAWKFFNAAVANETKAATLANKALDKACEWERAAFDGRA